MWRGDDNISITESMAELYYRLETELLTEWGMYDDLQLESQESRTERAIERELKMREIEMSDEFRAMHLSEQECEEELSLTLVDLSKLFLIESTQEDKKLIGRTL